MIEFSTLRLQHSRTTTALCWESCADALKCFDYSMLLQLHSRTSNWRSQHAGKAVPTLSSGPITACCFSCTHALRTGDRSMLEKQCRHSEEDRLHHAAPAALTHCELATAACWQNSVECTADALKLIVFSTLRLQHSRTRTALCWENCADALKWTDYSTLHMQHLHTTN